MNYMYSGVTSKPNRQSVFPLRLYVMKLAQHFEKIGSTDLCEWVKKILLLDNLANFKQKLLILVQEPIQFCQIW